MIQSVNKILTTLTQSSSESKNNAIQANILTIKTDSYEKTVVSPYDYTLYGRDYPRDEFEQNLASDDLKYFAFGNNGESRFPNVGAPPALKQQWLDYSKKMSDEGFSPDDLIKMQIGNTPTSFIWFPPENASADAKKAWLEALKKMDPVAADSMVDLIRDHFAGPYNPQDVNTPDYWNRISKGVAGISSFQDIIFICEENIKTTVSKGDTKEITEHMKKVENCFKILRDTFTTYNVK